jgi:hypothetical protein
MNAMTVRNFFMFSSFFACLLLTSCNLDDVFDKHSDSTGATVSDGSVSFNTVTPVTKSGSDGWQTVNVPLGSSGNASQSVSSSVSTRGIPVTGTGAPSGSFGVFGYEIKSGTDISAAAPSFMYNTQITRSGSFGSYTFSYYPSKYWPDDATTKVQFFSYYPYKGNGITSFPSATTTGIPTLAYSPSTTVSDQSDLMYTSAAATNNKTTGTAVGLNFKHALTRISFSVRKDVSLSSNAVVINSIRIYGVKSKGTLTLDASLSNPWALASDTTSYALSVTDGTLRPTANQALNTSDFQPVTSTNGYLMMLPQSLSSVNKVAVNYTVDGVAKSAIYVLSSATWSMGQSINYQFTLPTLLSAGTNCYILNPYTDGNRYFLLPITRANEYWGTSNSYTIGASDTWKMVIIWQDAPNLITLSNATGTGPAALATVSIPINASGNAVVGVMKTSGSMTNTIMWSWHLWVTSYNPNTTIMSYNGRTWMDRNLGAKNYGTGTDAYGLYYQWGRKDPFPGGTNNSKAMPTTYGTATPTIYGVGADLYMSIQNPNIFYLNGSTGNWLNYKDDLLWNNSGKTIFDPCPSGWCVPLSSYFSGVFPLNNTLSGFRDRDGTLYNAGNYGYWWAGNTYLPYGYHLESSGTVGYIPWGCHEC